MKAKNLLRYAFLFPAAILAFCLNSQGQTTTINNDKIRVGNGSETSINARGNMQQPFYKMGSYWFKLTYSSLPLNASFAVGGDGSNDWNLNGTQLHDPLMTNHSINTSGFNYNSGSSGTGTGVVVSTGELTFGGVVLQAEHTYELLPNNSFVKIKVKMTNISAVSADNVRVWVGTRDDWVGTTDRPTKQRGNLVDGSFQQISDASTRSAAVRVTSHSEGVLFYTDTDKANSIVNSCCTWSNITNQNPSTSTVTHSNDGSYGFYVRLDNLAPGQSDEFTWFYAAGSIGELDGIIGDVAQASGSISEITCSSAQFRAQAILSGTGYMMVVPAGSAAPTATEIAAGTDYGDVTVAYADNVTMTGGVAHDFEIESLNHSSSYTVYFVLENSGDGFSEIDVVSFNSGAPAAVNISTTGVSTCDGEDGMATANVTGGTAPFYFEWSTEESTAGISEKSPGTYGVEVTDSGGCPAVSASAEIGIDDTTLPTVIARDVALYLDESGAAVLTAEMVDDGSFDDCEIGGMGVSKSNFNCIDLGENNVTFEVTDIAGNSAQEVIIVTVADDRLPVAMVEDITLVLDENGLATLDAATADAGSTDNCSIVHREIDLTDFTCVDLGTHMATLTLVDASDNTTEVSFNVNVVDQTAPAATFADSPAIYLDAEGMAAPNQEALIAAVTDNCGITSTHFDIESFDCTQAGMRTLQFTAEDGSGNAATFVTQVMVADTIKPSFNLNTIQVAIGEEGLAHLTEEMLLPYTSDNCGIAEVAIQSTAMECNETGVGHTEIIVYDVHGNHIQRTLQVEFQDPIAPEVLVEDIVLIPDESGVAILDVEDLDYTAHDNCGIASLSLSETRFDCSRLGEVEVTLTATDHYGNSTEAVLVVTIVDNQAPAFEAIRDLTFCEGKVDFANLIKVHDNCSFEITQRHGPVSGTVLEPGTYPISFSATDFAGNTSSLNEEITVNPSPQINAPDEIEVIAGESVEIEVEGHGYNELVWSNGESGPVAVYTFEATSFIWFTASNSYGCEYSQSIRIHAMQELNTDEAADEIGFNVFPNPTNGILNLTFEGAVAADEYVVSITDIRGKLLSQELWVNASSNHPKQLNTSHLPSGMYLVSLRTGKLNQTAKFMKF